MEVDSINHFKSVFAHQFFVKAADHNYVVARWARIIGLTRESFIQAHQAVEKYLKAALVLNDVSVYDYKHDIVEMFLRHQEVFRGIAVTDLKKPEILSDELWRDWSALKFVEHLEMNGNPSSRYRLTSFYSYNSDIFMLDELVRQLRRLTIGMDWKVGEDFPVPTQLTASAGLTYREALSLNPSIQVRGDMLEEVEIKRGLNQLCGTL